MRLVGLVRCPELNGRLGTVLAKLLDEIDPKVERVKVHLDGDPPGTAKSLKMCNVEPVGGGTAPTENASGGGAIDWTFCDSPRLDVLGLLRRRDFAAVDECHTLVASVGTAMASNDGKYRQLHT